MDTAQNTPDTGTPTPEELQVEQESLAEVQDDDLRKSVVDSLGLEANDDNAELINKLVEREREQRSKLSGAIGAKIKYRQQLQQFNQKPSEPAENKSKTELDADAIRKQTEDTVRAQFDEEYLEDSDFSDTLKAEMRKVAKLNGTSVRATTKDSYIMHLQEKESQEKRTQEAAQNGGGERKGTQGDGNSMPDRFNDPTYMMTEKGQKDYDDWAASKQ